MSNKGDFVCGSHQVNALGDVDIQSFGSGVTLRALGEDADLSMDAGATVNLSTGSCILAMDGSTPDQGAIDLLAGEQGVIKIWCGMPLVGSLIKLEADKITLSVGPPGVGAMIEITPTGITMQVAQTSFQMTPTGITEQLAEVQRQLTPTGHTLAAAETELGLDAATGVNLSAAMGQLQMEATSQTEATMGKHAADAMRQQSAGH